MSDDCFRLVLILFKEIIDTGESYLVDILVNLLCCHTDATVTDGQCAGFLIQADADTQVTQFTLEVAGCCKCLQLLRGIDGV